MLDILIKNCDIVTADGSIRGSLGVKGEHIAGIYEVGSEPEASQTLVADGLTMIPGCIDMHSHHRAGAEPGYEYK